MDSTNKIIAVTGNIGSGKSTVMAMLAELGFATLSADEFTNQAYVVAKNSLVEFFGKDIIENGEISRTVLAKKAFANSESLEKLNKIMHPVIFSLIFDEVKNEKLAFVEVPLLFETGMEKYFSEVWLVACDTENKIERASIRDQKEKQEIEKRLSFQKKDEEKIEKSHIIFVNNGSIAGLKEQVMCAVTNLNIAN